MPFLGLLRIDVKLKLRVMLAICAWAWLMHFVDLEFQIMPSLPSQKDGFFHFTFPFVTRGLLVDVACLMFIGGLLAKIFIASLNRHPIYPRKDPRMAEALGVYVPPASAISIVPGHANEH